MSPLDISDNPPARRPAQNGGVNPQTTPKPERRFVGIRFNCCGIYQRIYINQAGTAYEGRCPKCGKPVKLKVGPGGTDSRFFDVY